MQKARLELRRACITVWDSVPIQLYSPSSDSLSGLSTGKARGIPPYVHFRHSTTLYIILSRSRAFYPERLFNIGELWAVQLKLLEEEYSAPPLLRFVGPAKG